MKTSLSVSFLVGLFLVGVAACPAIAKKMTYAETMSLAKEDFATKRYHFAAEGFERAAAMNPGDPEVHFQLGKALLQLDDPVGAKQEFRNCFELDPFGPLARAAKESMKSAAALRVKETRPPVDPQPIAGATVRTIRLQTNDAVNARLRSGENWYNTRMSDGARRFNGWPNLNLGPEVSDRRYINTSSRRTASYVDAYRARTEARRRAAALQESANNLNRLLAESPDTYGPKLRFYGTNLYVRYYGKEDPTAIRVFDDPIQELKAEADKIPPGWFKQWSSGR